MDDEIKYIKCLDCGNEQPDMGKGVECEECGARMPEPDDED